MNDLAFRQDAEQIERRKSIRRVVDIPVSFKTVSGTRECYMANISDNGAQLEMQPPPIVGASGWLILDDTEIYCKVIWADQKRCGIEFERSLGQNTLIDIAGPNRRDRPMVNRSRIQAGRKRSGLVGEG